MITARYINMENAIQRRESFEENVRLVNLPFPITRFPAKQIQSGNDFLTRGEIGCFLSHVEATLECNESDLLLIFEDDCIITNSFKKIIPSLISLHVDEEMPDIVFFNGGINTHNIDHIKKMLNHMEKIGDFSMDEYSNFQLIPAQELYVHGSSAYAISANGRQKINNIYANYIKNELKEPIDLLVKRCISSGIISASVVFPFVTGIDFDSKSQMEGRQASDYTKLYDAAANLFVADHGLIEKLEDFSLDINRSSFVNRLNNIASKLAMKNFYS